MIGVDEVGRGSWAGPLLVVAARQISNLPAGVTDSKLLTKFRREALIEDIESSCQLGEGWVQPEEIDEYGLAQAMRIGVSRALLMIGASWDESIIMDGNINYCPAEFKSVECQVGGDILHPIVGAASVYAKVRRDKHMISLAKLYPIYGFDKNVGYGTRLHQLMLRVHGPCQIHRRSYKPVKALS